MMRAGILLLPALLLAAPARAEVAPEEETEHVVQEGETLGGIASRAKVPRVLIAEANGLAEPYVIRVGQTLRIPRTRRHTVSEGETGFGISYQYAVPWNAIAVANGIAPDAPIRAGQVLLIPTILDVPDSNPAPDPVAQPVVKPAVSPVKNARLAWPLSGKVRRGYTPRGNRNYHDGIDIQAPAGTAVRAADAGKVIFAGDKGDYGNLVVIDHGSGWHTAYGFLSRITVRTGEQVNRAERIGLVGSTGLAKGDELHFEVRRDNAPVDPGTALPDRP